MDKKKFIKIPQFRPFLRRHLYLKVVFWVFFIILSTEAIILLTSYYIFYSKEMSVIHQIEILALVGCLIAAVLAIAVIIVLKLIKTIHADGDLDRSEDETNLLVDLHTAVAKCELLIFYQPQVNLISGKIVGMEALIRWLHPKIGFIDPAILVNMAEKSRLIIPMGTWILEEACMQNKEWLDMGYNLRLSVNLSALQIQDSGIVATVRQILERTMLPAENLELEITETAIIEDMGITIAVMLKLHDLGINISMDDFGTGYSSLSNLDRLPIQKLKIDQAFVHSISPYYTGPNIADSIIEMSKKLGLSTIAEGIETEYQKMYFSKLNCDEGQGYYFSKPVPADEFVKLLQRPLSHE